LYNKFAQMIFNDKMYLMKIKTNDNNCENKKIIIVNWTFFYFYNYYDLFKM
jgi:hypothetical protein